MLFLNWQTRIGLCLLLACKVGMMDLKKSDRIVRTLEQYWTTYVQFPPNGFDLEMCALVRHEHDVGIL